jgi:hypothetical protein
MIARAVQESATRLQKYSKTLSFIGWGTGILGAVGGIVLATTTGHHYEVNPFDTSLVTTTATHPYVLVGIASSLSAIVTAIALCAFAELLNWASQRTLAEESLPSAS